MKNCIKKSLKVSNGITLIALVITIIVLLILAGISISMLSGDNSILQKVTTAKTSSERAEAKEQAQMDIMAYIANKTANHEDSTLDNAKVKGILTGKSYVRTAGDSSFITAKGEYEIPYSELYSESSIEGGYGLRSDGKFYCKPNTPNEEEWQNRIYTGLVYDSDHFCYDDGLGCYVVWDDGYARPGGYQDWDMFSEDGIFLGPNWAD